MEEWISDENGIATVNGVPFPVPELELVILTLLMDPTRIAVVVDWGTVEENTVVRIFLGSEGLRRIKRIPEMPCSNLKEFASLLHRVVAILKFKVEYVPGLLVVDGKKRLALEDHLRVTIPGMDEGTYLASIRSVLETL